MRTPSIALAATAALSLTGCIQVSSDFLQRMEAQAKYEYYEESDFWADGRSMRTPPQGTVPREFPAGDPALTTGRVAGRFVTHFPLELNKEVLARGQKHYNIVCSQCHGVLGDGNSVVAENMALRLPPSLVTIADKPHGHFYAAITEGYGVMPSFAGEIPVQDRWAIVAYVRSLQTARGGKVAAQGVPQENR